MTSMQGFFSLALLAAIAAPGCYAGPADIAELPDEGLTAGDSAASGESSGDDPSGGDPSGDDSGGCEGDDCEPPAGACADGVIKVGPSPLRRLTSAEFNRTVRDLFADPELPWIDFSVADSKDGTRFDTNAEIPDPTIVEDTIAAAETIAAAALAPEGAFVAGLDCDLADTACVEPALRDLAGRAFRRPLAADEGAELVALYEGARDEWGGAQALEVAVTAVLASPRFLYLLEGGEPVPENTERPGLLRLTDHEVASRLSYFLWQTMPDDALFAAAEAGLLTTRAGVEDQARRMIADDRFAAAVSRFHEQWLELDHRLADETYKDPELYPEWSPALAQAMRKETKAFANSVIRGGDGKLSTLLGASYSTIDGALAELYGVDAPAESFDVVELDPGERAGILSLSGFLAAHAHADEGSWVHRGLFVRTEVLCGSIPPPPPDVDMSVLNNPDRTVDPACAGCHVLMDPIGWGMDNYDAIGRFNLLDEDGGLAHGTVEGPEHLDVVGDFAGLTDLSGRLAESEDVQACMARQWFRYATRRLEDTQADRCTIDRLAAGFVESEGDIRELLVEIAVSDGFRYIAAE
ncbi:MAG: DUF1592 domain-containing protein [Myxococcales bacterium]|nr:DUF1592 domain-containing protein [Myxococcales bacterium]